MNRIFSIAIILALQTLIACKTEKVSLNTTTIPFHEFPLVDSISFTPITEYIHGTPGEIRILDTELIILNSNKNSEFFFNNYGLLDNKVSNGYLKRGRGPLEALGAWLSGIHGDKFWTYDITSRKVLTIDLDQVLDDSSRKIFSEFKLANQYSRIDFLDSCTILAVGSAVTNSKISVVDIMSGNEIDEIGEFGTIPEKVPLDAFKDAYTSYIYIRPSGGKVALPYRYTDVVEIYDLSNHTNKAVWGPEGFDVQYEVGRHNFGFFMAKTEETRKAFVHGAVTDSLIYLLYSGHNRKDENWPYGKNLYIYDWDGNPIKKIVLDRYIIDFAVTDDDSKIYAHDHKSGYLIESDLKQLN